MVYGGASGLDSARHVNYSQGSGGVPGTPAAGNAFGTTVVPADLNGDGFTDLVVGAPGEDTGGVVDAGSLTVLWGGAQGLTTSVRVRTDAVRNRIAGNDVVAGDFDGDGRADIAFAVNAAAGGYPEAVRILSGIGADGTPATTRDTTMPDDFVDHLTAGDVNGDHVSDLVAMTRYDESDEAAVPHLYLGGPGGLTDGGWVDGPNGFPYYGQSSAIGDLNGDGYGDIVVGHGLDSFDADTELPTLGGALGVAYGGPAGPSTTIKPVWINQDTAGVPGIGEFDDGMGTSVTLGDVNGDGYADVVTGLPGEDFDGITDAGSVLVLRGSAKGLTGTGAQVFSQSTAGVPGVAEKDDAFGRTVTMVAGAAGARPQVVVGDPGENAANGSIWVFGRASTGPVAKGTVTFGSATMGAPATGAQFGAALSGGAHFIQTWPYVYAAGRAGTASGR